jgi:AraC family transcriptional regulator
MSSLFEEPCYIKNAFLASIAMNVYRELHTPGGPTSLLIEGLVLELLAHASRLESKRPGVSLKWLEDARRFIHDRFSDRMSLSTVAEEVGIHPSHLARSFRKHYGCSVGIYVMRLRVEYAARQLHRPDKPLSEIATSAGFYDQSQFTNVFRRHVGMTPSRYRLAAQSGNTLPRMHRLSKTQ